MKRSKENNQDTYESSGENGNTKPDESNNQENSQNNINPSDQPQADKKNEDLLVKIANYEVELKEIRDAYLRKAAEFENYKRRSDNEQSILLKYAAEPFIRNILQVYDDLDRSLKHANEENLQSLTEGVKLVYDKFTKILENQGVTKMDAKGKPFDVYFHEALMQQPAGGVPDHTVLEVVENGYMYKDKVIRHAKVIVSQAVEENNETEN
jgi:molecular chaperone GrpE